MALIEPTADASLADIFARRRLGIAMAAMVRIIANRIKEGYKSVAVRPPICRYTGETLVIPVRGQRVAQLPSQKMKRAAESRSLGCLYSYCRRLLVKRVETKNSRFDVGANASRINAHHRIFFSTESANTSLV